ARHLAVVDRAAVAVAPGDAGDVRQRGDIAIERRELAAALRATIADVADMVVADADEIDAAGAAHARRRRDLLRARVVDLVVRVRAPAVELAILRDRAAGLVAEVQLGHVVEPGDARRLQHRRLRRSHAAVADLALDVRAPAPDLPCRRQRTRLVPARGERAHDA